MRLGVSAPPAHKSFSLLLLPFVFLPTSISLFRCTEYKLIASQSFGQPNAPLRELLLLASKYDIVIEACWIRSEDNGLADALSRFDDRKVANLCPYWQSPFSSMIRPQPIYNQYQVRSL